MEALYSSTDKKLFEGNPTFLIKDGKLNQRELAKLRMGINELLGELRLKDVSNISDVDYAILEQNGKLSVFLKPEKQAVSLEDLKISKTSSKIGYAIIVDGEIDTSNLRNAHKSEIWLEKYLSKNKIKKQDVFLMTIDGNERINIIKKEIG